MAARLPYQETALARTSNAAPARRRGSDNPVFTADQVRALRARYKAGDPKDGCRAMAREFGVTPTAMQHLISGRTWKQVK